MNLFLNHQILSASVVTSNFAEVERHFFNGRVDVEWSNLFSQNQKMLYKE